ncbi:unnamed protein product [Diabrotica balteata]|uniref:Uncharacterized protein n=1 Tax=Diabrotica balteata TaxID=107213 RepID=A0A9N9XFP1_DIABA|nr:unnamed protein product [Diabrotica balteata]
MNNTITEPPLTQHLADKEFWNRVKQVPIFGYFPCHTQAVEKCVKIVTDASIKVCGEECRDGCIRGKLDARRNLPIFENKCQ